MNAIACKLLIVSDNRLFAESIGTALQAQSLVNSFEHLLKSQVRAYLQSDGVDPAIVMFDTSSFSDRVELLARLQSFRTQFPQALPLAVGDCTSVDAVTSCIESGAVAYILKTEALTELVATIEALKAGSSRCSAAVIKAVLQRLCDLSGAKTSGAHELTTELTEREIDVLRLVEQGMPNKEVARRLGIALATVKNHLHGAFEKLHVKNRRQAVRQAIAVGVLHCQVGRGVA